MYEKQIEEKSRQLKEDIIPTSYRASIEDDDLEIFLAAEWIETSSIDEITERQVQLCVEERCNHKADGGHLFLINLAVKNVAMDMQMIESNKRVWTLRRDYCNALRNAGYGDLHIKKPHLAINHILGKLKPHALYKRMNDLISWRKDENFHKENFDRFVREIATQAERIQSEQGVPSQFSNTFVDSRMRREPLFREKQIKHENPNSKRHKQVSHKDEVRGVKRKSDEYETPLCLNPTCRAKDERHYLSRCARSDKNTKASLLEEFRKAKRARIEAGRGGTGTVGQITNAVALSHSSVFKASFADGKIEADIMADQRADANIMSKRLMMRIQREMPELQPVALCSAQVYKSVTGEPCVTCNWEVSMDVFLRIRHGSSLILRNVLWKVADENITTTIIGRRV